MVHVQVECATIEGSVLYVLYTSGEVRRHKVAQLEQKKKKATAVGNIIFRPEFKVLKMQRADVFHSVLSPFIMFTDILMC